MELPEINARIRALIDKHSNGRITKFAELCGIKSAYKLNRLFLPDKRNGIIPEPSLDIVTKISETLNIGLDWLVFGEGGGAVNEPDAQYGKMPSDEKLNFIMKQNAEILDKLDRNIAIDTIKRAKEVLKQHDKKPNNH